MTYHNVKLTPKPRRKKTDQPIVEVVKEVLVKTDNPAVGWGDSGLLHAVAEALGWPHDAWATEKRVLDAIDHGVRKHPGVLEKRYTDIGGRACRYFKLIAMEKA